MPNEIKPDFSFQGSRNNNSIDANNVFLGETDQYFKINQPYILDMVTLERLFFQTIPPNLDMNPESKWATLEAPGRNNPLYAYGGSEDTLKFSITWYANSASRQDVLLKCKWLESLTKNNGYDEKPHRVKFIMGQLFQDANWIIETAPYKLGQFNREIGMLPCFATQELTLKRITVNNRTRAEILKIDS